MVSYIKSVCSSYQSNSGQALPTAAIEAALAATIQDVCSCDFATTNIESVQTSCQNGSSYLKAVATLVYADDQGIITSSTLIKFLGNWLVIEEEAAVLTTADGKSVPVVSVQACDPLCSDTQAPPPSQGSSSAEDDDGGAAIAGAVIGGVILGAILVALPTLIIM